MENIDALKLINKMQRCIIKSGITDESLLEDLMKLREFAITEEKPTIAKVTRLTKEHLEKYGNFHIPIPEDPLDEDEEEEGEEEVEKEPVAEDNTSDADKASESLDYLLSIISKSENKMNAAELKEYRDALMSFAAAN